MAAAAAPNRTGIYRPCKPSFFVKEMNLTDGSKTFDIWINRNDSECLMLIDSAISERHANAVCDALNVALETYGVVVARAAS